MELINKTFTTTIDGKEIQQDRTIIIIARLDTKEKVLSIEDFKTSDQNWKAIFCFTAYGSNKLFLRHFVDADTLLLFANDVVLGKAASLEDYKGTPSNKYQTGFESRVLKINFDSNLGSGKGAFAINFTQGPGNKTELGAVTPVKDAEVTRGSMIIQTNLFRAAMLQVLEFYRAKTTATVLKNWNVIGYT